MLQYISNDIKNSSNRWVLTPTIVLWRFRSPFGLQLPQWEFHLGVWGFIPSHYLHYFHSLHSWEHVMWLLGLPLGLQPYNPLALVVSPRLGLRHLLHYKFFEQGGVLSQERLLATLLLVPTRLHSNPPCFSIEP